MKINVKSMAAVAMVATLLFSIQQAQAVSFIGGTIISEQTAESPCCVAENIFSFNGGTGSILGIADQQQLGLDSRGNNNSLWNAGTAFNSPSGNVVFSIAPPAGEDFVTGFQVMNATNGVFDERQTASIEVEVSTDNGGSFQSVLVTALDVVVTDGNNQGTDFAPAPAQEFLLSDAIGGVDQIRLTAFRVAGDQSASLAEFRVIVDSAPPVPEPATAALLALGVGGFVMRRRRRLA